MKAHLVLSSGAKFEGQLIGSAREAIGEVVFNTGMTGYQEILTDPSYAGQIVVFTYPMIGNYGINSDDFESGQIQPAAIVVRQACDKPSNWRSSQTLSQHLEMRGAPGIQGVDTRAITQLIRSEGATMGIVSTRDPDEAYSKLMSSASYDETDFVYKVTTKSAYAWGYEGREELEEPSTRAYQRKIVALDCGPKHNILRRFAALGVRTIVVPATASADEILGFTPDGILLSPGPGDPSRLAPIVQTVQKLLGQKPILGICLGNQLLCHAIGAKTYKLKFGHRGSNHPVKDLTDGTVTITSQNHGYAVDADSLAGTGAEVTQINLNDGTVEGIAVPELRATSIQYHPEAAPGPWDSRKYFAAFVEEMGR